MEEGEDGCAAKGNGTGERPSRSPAPIGRPFMEKLRANPGLAVRKSAARARWEEELVRTAEGLGKAGTIPETSNGETA